MINLKIYICIIYLIHLSVDFEYASKFFLIGSINSSKFISSSAANTSALLIVWAFLPWANSFDL